MQATDATRRQAALMLQAAELRSTAAQPQQRSRARFLAGAVTSQVDGDGLQDGIGH